MAIGLQLYSLKDEAKENFDRVLALTAQAGYGMVEFAGYFGNTSEQMNRLLKQHNLKAVSAHAGFQRLSEALDEELDYAKQVGFKLIVCPYSPCETKERTIEDARMVEAWAQKAAKQGVTIGYHNHAHEFVNQFDGQYAMDLLLETAPTVKFQPDVFWIAAAGVDPAAYMAPLVKAGRICAVHAKELAKEGQDNVYIGQGKIDFFTIARLCPPSIYPWIVEQEEYSGDHYDGIVQSYQGLKKVFDRL
jgi:sugar phosphate isomerase/epimerase